MLKLRFRWLAFTVVSVTGACECGTRAHARFPLQLRPHFIHHELRGCWIGTRREGGDTQGDLLCQGWGSCEITGQRGLHRRLLLALDVLWDALPPPIKHCRQSVIALEDGMGRERERMRV